MNLPEWPPRTIAVLATTSPGGPHIIPVSAPVRVGGDSILLGLRRTRDSLTRIRRDPHVALLFLAEGDVAFTARGTARIIAEQMGPDPGYCAVEILVDAVDDHRQHAFTITAGVDRSWRDTDEQAALRKRVGTLSSLAALRIRCRAAATERRER